MAIKNQSITIQFTAWDTSANAGKTGDGGNFTLKLIQDGTAASPTNSASEVDATNCPGVYKLVITAGEMDYNTITLAGKSSTSNVVIIPVHIITEMGTVAVIDGIVDTITGHIQADYGATEKAAIDLLDDVDGGLGDVHTVTNAIKAKTDNLPTDPADESSIEAAITAAHATTNGKIDAVDDYVDTEIAAMIGTLAAIQGYVDDLESRLTAARAGYLDLINTNLDAKVSEVGGGSLTAESIRIEMDANSKLANLPADPADESSLEAAINAAHATTDALISAITGGGLTEKTYTLTDANTGLPLAGVQVWATTDEAGANQVDITRTTNDAGQVTFRFNLPAGTPIYIWNRYMAEGDAPDEEEV